MPTRNNDHPLRGFVVPFEQFVFANLDVANSDFSELTPRPGSSVPPTARAKLVPVISAGQGEDAKVVVKRGGHPGGRDAGLRCTFQDASDVEYGYSDGAITQWRILDTSTGATFAADTMPDSQKVIAVWQGPAPNYLTRSVWDPESRTWSAAATISSDLQVSPVAVVVLPTGRILAWGGDGSENRSYYSDDDGATWSLYAVNPLPSTLGAGDADMQVVDDTVVFVHQETGGTIRQYASNDFGASFTQVGSTIAGTGNKGLKLVPFDGGKLLFAYHGSTEPEYRIIGSPWSALSDATAQDFGYGAPQNGLTAWEDNGSLYYLLSVGGSLRLEVSDDGGESFADTVIPRIFESGDTSTFYARCHAVRSMGETLLLARTQATDATVNNDLHVTHIGGWAGRAEMPPTAESSGGNCTSWIAWEYPSNQTPLTETALGGSASLVDTALTGGYLAVSSPSSDYIHWGENLGSEVFNWRAEIEVRVNSGGSTAAPNVGAKLYFDDGTDRHEVELCLTTSAIVIRDETNGVTEINIAADLTEWTQILVWVDEHLDGAFRRWTVGVMWKRPEDWEWSEPQFTSSMVGTATTGAGSEYRFGHCEADTADSDWRHFLLVWDDTSGETSERVRTSSASGNEDLQGKALSPVPTPIPVIGSAGQAAHLAAVSGPGQLGETYDIAAEHDYPIENIFHEVSPSKARKWRSQDTSAQTIRVSWDDLHWLSDYSTSIAIAMFGCNFPTATVRGVAGGVTTTLGTFDLRHGTGLSYFSAERTLGPSTTQATGLRYLDEMELVGGSVSFGGGVVRRITHNTPGVFSTESKRAFLTLDTAISGTSGSCDIWHPDGVLVLHDIQDDFDALEIEIPSTDTAEGYFEIGQIVVGAVRPAGFTWSWGWTWSKEPNAETRRDAYGTSRARRMGPAPRTLTVPWPDGVDASALRGTAPEFDYLAADSGWELAAYPDVWGFIFGLMERTKSGQVPVIALTEIPAEDAMVTAQHAFMYGRISSSFQVDGVVGNEGSDEVYRGSALTLQELL